MIIHKEPANNLLTISAAAGSWSGNTVEVMGEIGYMYINPDSASTQYDFKLTGPDGEKAFYRKNITGEFICYDKILVRGIYTMAIENATANKSFDLKILLKE